MQPKLQEWWLRKTARVKNALSSRKRPTQTSAASPSVDDDVDDDDVDDSQRLPLTPTPSAIALPLELQKASPNSIFQRLPVELRRQILIEAFGGRTVHIDLEWGQPRQLRLDAHPGLGLQVRHCGMVEPPPGTTAPVRDNSAPARWRWFGCVCHRDPEPTTRSRRRTALISEQWFDVCLQGQAGWCHTSAGDAPRNCLIGCMGWLTACRQAYLEGIDVLYSTNTFQLLLRRLENRASKNDIPSLVSPARVAMITSLELALIVESEDVADPLSKTFYRILRTYHAPFPTIVPCLGAHAFKTLLEVIPHAFPNLIYLDLSLHRFWLDRQDGRDYHRLSETHIMRPFDDLVRKFADIRNPFNYEFSIAIPAHIYQIRFESDVQASRKFKPSTSAFTAERVWRIVPGQEEGGKLGYWIKKGLENNQYKFAHMMAP